MIITQLSAQLLFIDYGTWIITTADSLLKVALTILNVNVGKGVGICTCLSGTVFPKTILAGMGAKLSDEGSENYQM